MKVFKPRNGRIPAAGALQKSVQKEFNLLSCEKIESKTNLHPPNSRVWLCFIYDGGCTGPKRGDICCIPKPKFTKEISSKST